MGRPPTTKELAAIILATPPGPEREWLLERYWAKVAADRSPEQAQWWAEELAWLQTHSEELRPTTTSSPPATPSPADRPALGAFRTAEQRTAARRRAVKLARQRNGSSR